MAQTSRPRRNGVEFGGDVSPAFEDSDPRPTSSKLLCRRGSWSDPWQLGDAQVVPRSIRWTESRVLVLVQCSTIFLTLCSPNCVHGGCGCAAGSKTWCCGWKVTAKRIRKPLGPATLWPRHKVNGETLSPDRGSTQKQPAAPNSSE